MFKGIKGTIARHGASGLGVYLVTKAIGDFNYTVEDVQSFLDALLKIAENMESIAGLILVMIAAGSSHIKDKNDKTAIKGKIKDEKITYND